jgi:hypothetical protein
LSIPAIKKHRNVIKQVLTEAVIAERIANNPARDIPLPAKEENAYSVYGEQVKR